MINQQGNPSFGKNPFGSKNLIVGLIVLVLGVVGLFFLAKGIFWLLTKLALLLFVVSLFIDYKVTVDYIKFLINTTKKNPLIGLVAIILTFIGHPIVAGFLFFKAIAKRQLKKFVDKNKPVEEEFTEYTEVEEDDDVLILPEIETAKPSQKQNNEYDNLFD